MFTHTHPDGGVLPALLSLPVPPLQLILSTSVIFRHSRLTMSFHDQHGLLCAISYGSGTRFISLCITLTSVFQQLWEPHALPSLTYITISSSFALTVALPHPLPQFFCLSACAYLYPCNYFHMVLAVVCVLPDRQCLSENRCPMSVTSRIGIYIKVVVLRFLTH